jgi:hypothetical protein
LRGALRTLYASSALLGARTAFRVAEYWTIAQSNYWEPGVDVQSLSPVLRYEWFFYVFEASLMLANTMLVNARHPRRYLPSSRKTYLSPRDGRTEVRGPGYEDGRPWVLTLVDPFDLWGLARGRDKGRMFWEEEAVEVKGDRKEEGRGVEAQA